MAGEATVQAAEETAATRVAGLQVKAVLVFGREATLVASWVVEGTRRR